MPKTKYKAVIFDFDDTLVKAHEVIWALHKAVAKKFYNIDLSDEVILKHWGKPFPILVSELYQNTDTLENMIAANRSLTNDFLKKELRGSAETVTKLLDNGIRVGILSATIKSHILDDFNRLNFPTDRLDIIQSAEDTLVHKPDPDVFLPLLKKLKEEGIEKEDIVYVGDSLDDLRAATGAGIDFIAVNTGLYSSADFKKHGAKVVIKDITEIIKFLY